jgi:hypothetical protein
MDGEKMIFGAANNYVPFGFWPPHAPLPNQGPVFGSTAGSSTGAGATMSLNWPEFVPSRPGVGDGDANAGSGLLASATTKQVPTLKETDLSQPVEEEEDIIMSEQEQTLEQVKRERDELKKDLDIEYDRRFDEQARNERLTEQLVKANTELANSQRAVQNIEHSLKESESKLAEDQAEIQALKSRNAKADFQLAQTNTAFSDARKQIDKLYADAAHWREAHKEAAIARDEYKLKFEDTHLQFKDLQDQWEEAVAETADLKATLEEHLKFEERNDLQSDIAEANAEHERTLRIIEVKDERISHLEGLLQKEIERNRHDADEKARAAAASPVDDDRHIGSMGGSLEAELSMIDDSEWIAPGTSDYEPEYVSLSTSDVHVAATVEPRDPSPAPSPTVHVQQAASTEPEAAKTPVQSVNVREAASTKPEAARSPIQTIEVREAASSLPAEPPRIQLSFYNARDVFSCAPDQPAVTPLAFSAQNAVTTEPVEPARTPISLDDVHTIASTEPMEPAPVPLSFADARDIFNYAPVDPASSPSALSPQSTTSIAPIELARAPLSLDDVHKVASTEPTEPTRSSLSLYGVHDIASYAPDEPVGARLAMYEEEVASFSPRRPVPKASELVGHEIANFAPREPILPVLAMSPTETVSTSPMAPQNSTAELSTQTDAPATTTDISAQTDAPALTSQVVLQAALETVPVQPKAQTAAVKPVNRIAPIMVTREVEPIEQVSLKPELKRPIAVASKKTVFIGWITYLVGILLAGYILVLEAELAAWKNANGVGFGGGYGNVASRSGAYGNGRHVFGVIPMGMGIGNTWVSEQIARRMSVAISLFEDFAGITNEPHY